MKSLDELIEEIRREARGEPPASPDQVAVEPSPPEEAELPKAPQEPEVLIDVHLTEPRVPDDDPLLGETPTFLEDEDQDDEDLIRFLGQPIAPATPPPLPGTTPLPDWPPVQPKRVRKVRQRRAARGARGLQIAAAVVILTAGALVGIRVLGDRASGPQPVTVPPLAEQDVAAWAVWDPEMPDIAFVTVITGGGDLDPIALGIPPYTYVNVPGYGDATVGDAVALYDPDLLTAAVENLIGIRVDALERSSLDDLAAVVDRLGGIEVEGELLDGAEVVSSLTQGEDDPVEAELRFVQWQSVTDGILRASAGRAADLAEILPEEIAAVVAAAGSGGAEVLELPVSDIGSGLARPDAEAVRALVAERFVPNRTTSGEVRLAILNGAGVPGIGERVSRVLLPAGFKVVVSGNAPSFDVEETQVIAEGEEFLQEAELAQRLLGVGRVYLGEQPTGLVDVTVIVGRDFAGK
jgi:polyisoprenyl-teichoic acid--peptidoglycan teichoic acid transferase